MLIKVWKYQLCDKRTGTPIANAKACVLRKAGSSSKARSTLSRPGPQAAHHRGSLPALEEERPAGERGRTTPGHWVTDGQRGDVSRRRRSSQALAGDTERPRTQRRPPGKVRDGSARPRQSHRPGRARRVKGASSAVRKPTSPAWIY